jgi:hypothetical protein
LSPFQGDYVFLCLELSDVGKVFFLLRFFMMRGSGPALLLFLSPSNHPAGRFAPACPEKTRLKPNIQSQLHHSAYPWRKLLPWEGIAYQFVIPMSREDHLGLVDGVSSLLHEDTFEGRVSLLTEDSSVEQ